MKALCLSLFVLLPVSLGADCTWPCPTFIRGDCDEDGDVDFDDLDCVGVCWYYFGTGQEDCPVILDRVDVDDNGSIDINDYNALNSFLNTGSPTPPSPYPSAGLDGTDDGEPCDIRYILETVDDGTGNNGPCTGSEDWDLCGDSDGIGEPWVELFVKNPDTGLECNPGYRESTLSDTYFGIDSGFGSGKDNYTMRFLNSGVVQLTGELLFEPSYDPRLTTCLSCGSSDFDYLEIHCNDTASKIALDFKPEGKNREQIVLALNGPHEILLEQSEFCPSISLDQCEVSLWESTTVSYTVLGTTIASAICSQYPTLSVDTEIDFQKIQVKGIRFELDQGNFDLAATDKHRLELKITAQNWKWEEAE